MCTDTLADDINHKRQSYQRQRRPVVALGHRPGTCAVARRKACSLAGQSTCWPVARSTAAMSHSTRSTAERKMCASTAVIASRSRSVAAGSADSWIRGALRLVVGKWEVLSFGAAGGGLLRPRHASERLRRRYRVRRRALSLRAVQGGSWGAVLRQGRRHFRSAVALARVAHMHAPAQPPRRAPRRPNALKAAQPPPRQLRGGGGGGGRGGRGGRGAGAVLGDGTLETVPT